MQLDMQPRLGAPSRVSPAGALFPSQPLREGRGARRGDPFSVYRRCAPINGPSFWSSGTNYRTTERQQTEIAG